MLVARPETGSPWAALALYAAQDTASMADVFSGSSKKAERAAGQYRGQQLELLEKTRAQYEQQMAQMRALQAGMGAQAGPAAQAPSVSGAKANGGIPTWGWVAAGLGLVGVVLFIRRRREG